MLQEQTTNRVRVAYLNWLREDVEHGNAAGLAHETGLHKTRLEEASADSGGVLGGVHADGEQRDAHCRTGHLLPRRDECLELRA